MIHAGSNPTSRQGATAALLSRCSALINGIECSGLPPHSCLAFGSEYRVRVDDPDKCTRCINSLYSVIAVVAILVLFVVGLGLYAYMITRHQSSTKWMVSNGAIFVEHLQTVEVISKMRMAWPQTARHVMGWAAISGFSPEASRPECLFGEDVPVFYALSLSRVGFPLLMLCLVALLHTLASVYGCSADNLDVAAERVLRRTPKGLQRSIRALLASRGRNGRVSSTLWNRRLTRTSRRSSRASKGEEGQPAGYRPSPADHLELIESVVIQISMSSTWQLCAELILATSTGIAGSDAQRFALIGTSLAAILLFVEVLLVTKYAYQMRRLGYFSRAHARARQDSLPRQGAALPPPPGCLTILCGGRLSDQSLRHRLYFITERFAKHAPCEASATRPCGPSAR